MSKNRVLAVLLHGSVLVCFVLFLLWNAGKFDHGATAAAAFSEPVGSLPVPARIAPADPVDAVLWEDLQAGRAVCWRGVYARPVGVQASPVVVLVDGQAVACP
jgi:hypothetical protein